MVIYECDMCKWTTIDKYEMKEIVLSERNHDYTVESRFLLCSDCGKKIGDFIRGHKSRMEEKGVEE